MEQLLVKKYKQIVYLETIVNSSMKLNTFEDSYIAKIVKQIEKLRKEVQEIDIVNKDRKGDWICLASCRRFWLLDPRPEDIHIEDIAHGLSMICRFGGQVKNFYSVAQHSVLVSEELNEQYALAGLLHDAAESYIGDLITPVKNIVRNYKEIEDNIMDCVIKRFNLPLDIVSWKEVKRADLIMMATEFRDVARCGIRQHGFDYPPSIKKIRTCWQQGKAKKEFLERFNQLCPKAVQINLGLNQDLAAVT